MRLLAITGIMVLAGCSSGPTAEQKSAENKPAVAYFKVDPATAGSVKGKVNFAGKAPKMRQINMESEEDCVKEWKTAPTDPSVTVNPNGTLRNVFVYIKSGLEDKHFEPVKVAVKFDQRGCMFVPRIVAAGVGQPIEITNSDTVQHNIHPIPKKNREWNQAQSPGNGALEREFSQPEIGIPVKCNVHAWMRAYFHIMPHPYFETTGEEGTFEIKNLPPGDYVIATWHERYPAQEQKITVAPSAAATADFTFKGE